MKIPAFATGRGLAVLMGLIAWSTTALADGEISSDELKVLATDHIGPHLRDVVVRKAESVRAAREARGTLGRTKFEQWTRQIKSSADAIDFTHWATSALADGRVDAGEIMDLLIQHIAPVAIAAISDALDGDDSPPDDTTSQGPQTT